jgi:hypothetical protein
LKKRANIVAAVGLLLSVAACGPAATMPPPNPGTLTLKWLPVSPSAPQPSLTIESLTLEDVTVFGDVAPSGSSIVREINVSLLGTPSPLVFNTLPQGLYSRIRFLVNEIHIEGTYNGIPLHIQFESESAIVDLRSSTGQEVLPEHDGAFSISIDDNSWFANQLLDGATQTSGQIVISSLSNPTIAQTLATRIASSFSLQPPPTP